MKDQRHPLYWHLSMTYFHATRRRVNSARAVEHSCQRGTRPTSTSTDTRTSPWYRASWGVNPGVEDDQVEAAVGWLEAEWNGEPYVPDDLLPTVSV
jgi:hypothetical protein